jgi:hypothetical protein
VQVVPNILHLLARLRDVFGDLPAEGVHRRRIPVEVAEERPAVKNDAVENKKENSKTAEAKKASAKANVAPSKPSASKTSVSVKPGDLKSSGIEVPALYID